MDEQTTVAATDPRDEKIKELKERIKELEPHVPEATYAFNTNLVCGMMRGQWTMRARPGEDGKSFVFRVNAMLKYLGESGWESALSNLPTADLSSIGAPGAAPQPAPVAQAATANGGTFHCLLLKVGLSYSGNKPQLQFEVAEQDKPLTFTAANVNDLAKFLQPVGAFNAAQLVNGAKFGVNYLVDWQLSKPNAEGKQYKNITALRINA